MSFQTLKEEPTPIFDGEPSCLKSMTIHIIHESYKTAGGSFLMMLKKSQKTGGSDKCSTFQNKKDTNLTK